MQISDPLSNSPSFKAFSNSPYKSIKHTTYFLVYDELFSIYRNRDITFVEVGILGGGSLHMWRDFFGEQARIIGVDLNPNSKKWEEFDFEIHIGDQSDPNFWESFFNKVGPIDILLDDGGHMYHQQITTTISALPHIRDGGLLVIEDTHTSYMEGFGLKRHSFIRFTRKLVDDLNYRFGQLRKEQSIQNFYSIRYFESMIAFYISNQQSSMNSEFISNSGIDDLAEDFRYHNVAPHQNFTRNLLNSTRVQKSRYLRDFFWKLDKLISLYQITKQFSKRHYRKTR